MNNYPRSQFQRQTYYGAGNIMPFHAGYGSNHGTFTRASMPQSFFGRPANGVVNGYNFQQPSKQVRNAVQRYLDINCTDNCNRNAGNAELTQNDISWLDSSFQCEPCKKSFKDNNCLGAHLKTHLKCEFPDCSFIASRQMLKLHEIQCHRKGKMKIILDTPEQIAKWRAERKRNYPSAANIARKESEQQRRIGSGQVINKKEFRYNRKHGWKQQRGKIDNRRGRNTRQREDDTLTQSLNNNAINADLLHEKQNKECAMQNGDLLDSNGKKECKETTRALSNLGSLAADYATSSSDEDNVNNMEQKEHTEKSAKFEGGSTPGNKKQKLESNLDKDTRNKRQKRLSKKHAQTQNKPSSSRPTLLEMLLASDIRHERNVMLQCIRFIVKKNFFGVECKGNTS